MLVVGVNGSGKTTTIGKLAAKFHAEGRSVMLAAGDTFRAAAIDQLKIWGGRSGATVIARAPGADAAGLAFDALTEARGEEIDVLLVDTAGRLQNKAVLMDELEKIVRVMKKVDAAAPHAVLLVLDATRRAERAVAGRGVPQHRRRHRAGHDQARRHRARRHPRRDRGEIRPAGAFHRRRRGHRRPRAVLGEGFCARDRRGLNGDPSYTPLLMEIDVHTAHEREKPQLNPGLKLVLDLGPLAAVLPRQLAAGAVCAAAGAVSCPRSCCTGEHAGIFAATAVFMPAVLIALAIGYALTRHLPVMPLVTAVIVVVFGGLTLALQNETFIKLKPTIIYVLFGAVLLGGLAFGKPLLGMVFDSVFHLTDEGWRKLTLRWALFFFVLAVLNEIVWRTQTTDFWVSFKVFGVVPLTFLFAALQYPLLTKYAAPERRSSE